ncbi:MAG: protein kinase domain-containing protein [Planctomycetales bacterium]
MKDSRLESIFDAALQKATSAERDAFLEGACGTDALLRERVETLLRAHDAAGNFLSATLVGETPEEGPGALIGRYKLLQKIGEGGFGVVYMAEQLEPVRRKVALKIIKLGMDTRQVVARFESERQALALMDHPHIARVLDGGATTSGRPYFVMELVRGIPITEYCDRNGVALRERLMLFVAVCQAVQHAHQKGIIHRDIKPSNVLVTLHDGLAVPKVIDFGIAKATGQRLTDKTVFTEFRQIVGTPQYMSPEQAEMSGLDIDTRCDIYSLGVLLYELLTGTTPLEPGWLQSVNYGEMQRIIREEDPPCPSQRVSTLHEQLETVAKNRRIEPRGLSRFFRGDLDWIVMKALEKDRTRRYSTASTLAADVERFLRYEPVEASPPSVLYRLRKFVRRNRTGVTASLLVAVALVAGLAVATAGFLRARSEADRARQIAAFLEEIVVAINPADADARQVDVEEVAQRARRLFGHDHATVAAALDSLGTQLQHSGNFADAEQLFSEAEQIWRDKRAPQSPSRAMTLIHLGSVRREAGNDDGAEQTLREALSIAQSLPEGMQLSFSEGRTELAALLQKRGQFDEAERLLREAIRTRRAQPGSQQYRLASAQEQLINVLIAAGKNDAAEEAFEEGLTLYQPLFPPDSPTLAHYHFAYGHWLRQHGRLEKAEPYLREAVRIYRGMDSPPREYQLMALDGLFQLLRRRDQAIDETLTVFQECMQAMTHLYGVDHPNLGAHLFGFAHALGESNRSADAIPLLIEGLRIQRKARPDDWLKSPAIQSLERHVRRLVVARGNPTDKYQAALDGSLCLTNEIRDSARHQHLRGMAYYRLGQFGQAVQDLSHAPGESAPESEESAAERLAFLALACHATGHDDEALQAARELKQMLPPPEGSFASETLALIAETEAAIPARQGE